MAKKNKSLPEKKPSPPREKPHRTFKQVVVDNIKSFGSALLVFYFVTTFFVQAFTIPTSSMVATLMVGDFIFVNKFIYGAQTPANIPLTSIELPQYRFPAFREPAQGDVLVFRFPHPELKPDQRGLDYIKRCVAVGGQTVEVRNKELYVDSIRFSEKFNFEGIHYDPNFISRLNDAYPPGMGTGDNFGPFRVPAKGDKIPLSPTRVELVKYLALRDGHDFQIRPDGYYVDGNRTEEYEVGQDYYFMMGDNRDNSLDSRYWGPVPRNHISGEGMLIYWSNVEAAKQTNMILKVFSTLNLSKVNWKRIGTIVR